MGGGGIRALRNALPSCILPNDNSGKGQSMNRRGVSINRGTLTIVAIFLLFVAALCCLSLAPRTVSAQNASAAPASVYNPYPPGILPADLDSELARVQREVAG